MHLQNSEACAAVIEINQMSFSYPHNRVLNEIDLTIASGEFIGIIGPNGGGKTTLLKLIMGLLKPSRGSIKVFGRNPADPFVLCKMAYVPQAIRFDREFPISVEEVVLMGVLRHLPWYGAFKSLERKSALAALETVGLANMAKASFGTLSGGQAQRVLIARALVSSPELLLLDEPTASIDTKAEADIYALLQTLKKSITILMVTHDLGTAIDQVSRVLCVQGTAFPLERQQVCKHYSFGLYPSAANAKL